MEQNLQETYRKQVDFFASGATKTISFRKNALKKLQQALKQEEKQIYEALHQDLSKSNFEAFLTEYHVITDELDDYINNVEKWSRPKTVLPSLLNFPSTAHIYKEPYGNVLIISPWNYPFQLALGPLIGAVAAGNTVILKPSEFSRATSQLLCSLVNKSFDPEHVAVIQGDAQVSRQLTSLQWDYIFFTGSTQVGKKVYEAAAKNLTPVTLELGGKNPCVVHESADVAIAARRIVWGKFLNAGQTCIAPDYILVHESIRTQLLEQLELNIKSFYGENPRLSPDYSRIIRKEHLEGLVKMLQDVTIYHGGNYDLDELYLAPTLLENVDREHPSMQDEIFGPILPVISYTSKNEIEEWIHSYGKSLGGYCFTEDKNFRKWFIGNFSFGGGVINDSIVQFVNKRLPFGGVGKSGIGSYHGKKTFEVFSHAKSVVHRRTWLDITLKYPPFKGKLKKIKTLLKWT
ncbi:MAG: aldehyde dehydrogenase [Nonlabens sp.]